MIKNQDDAQDADDNKKTNNTKPKKEKKQQADQTLVVIKDKIINLFESNKNDTIQNLLDDNAGFFDSNAKFIIGSTEKDLAPIYKKANNKIKEVTTYYRNLDNRSFKTEMKRLFKDEPMNNNVLLQFKYEQEQKIKQAGIMLELIQLKMDIQTFDVQALEIIKKEAESRSLVVPPSFKGISNSQEMDDDIDYPIDPPPPLKKQKSKETKETKEPTKEIKAGGGGSKSIQTPASAPAKPLLSLIGAMQENPLFLRRKQQNQG